jgi:NADPH-dependent 2,4-dienoyl-CoA reductase/sulfur reductase-like enzyme
MRTIAVVGGGIAGWEAARGARRSDPGARVVLLNEEPHPLYSACVLADYISGEIERSRVFLRALEDYKKEGIDYRPHTAVVDWSPDERLLILQGGELHYDALVLATGSIPWIPPLPGAQRPGVQTLKTLADADGLRGVPVGRIVVVGGGPIGIEAAVALRRSGWEVHLVELLPRLLPRLFDEPLSILLKERLEACGIEVVLGERVLEVFGAEAVEGIRTEKRVLKADRVLFVIGMRPEVSLARRGGLELGPSGGILVDDRMMTTRKDVWACGDCVESRDLLTGRRGLFMLWNNARLQGRVAGTNAGGGSRRFPGSLNITTIQIFGEAAASVGQTAAELEREGGTLLYKPIYGGGMGLVLKAGKLVGVQVVGPTERVGGALSLLLRRGDLSNLIQRSSISGRVVPGLWPLRGMEKTLRDLLLRG